MEDGGDSRHPLRRARGGVENLTMKYFREIASYPLLDVEQERVIAEKIIALERRQWANVLANPLRARGIVAAISHVFPWLRKRFRFIHRAAGRARAGRGRLPARSHAAYLREVERLSRTLRASDIDRIILEELEDAIVGSEGEEQGRGARRDEYAGRIAATRRELRELKNFFVSSNLRLVISIARRHSRGSLPLMDLVQEGNLGLLKAIERYDPGMGYRFSTYASWWIRHAINRALADKSRTVRLPVHMIDATQKVRRLRFAVMAREGREPSDEEIARTSGMNMKKLRKVQREHSGQMISLDRTISDESGQRFIDVIQDAQAANPVEEIAFNDWCAEIGRLLSVLTPIESCVVRYRFGVDSQEELTLKEIGEMYHLSRERIRQIQKAAIEKLRTGIRGLY